MANRVSIGPKLTGETVLQQFNFTSNLSPTETISTAVVICTVYSGVDSNPSAVVSGAAAIATPVVNQSITGGVLGTIYELICRIVTSLGQTLELSGYLAIVTDLP